MRFPDFPELPALPSLDAETWRRIALVLLALAVAAVTTIAIVGGAPGAGRPDPRDLVPADALSYVEIHLDGGREQPAAAGAFSARLPLLTRQVVGRFEVALPFHAAGLQPIPPWLGDEAAFAGLHHEDQLELLASDDDEAALRFAGRVVGNGAKSDYRGIRILSGKHESAAIIGSFLAIGTDEAIRGAIDTSLGGPSLAGYRPARAVLSALPAPSYARVYVAPAAGQSVGPLGTLRGPAAASVRFTHSSLELAVHVGLDRDARPPVAKLDGFQPTLPRTLRAGTLGYLGGGPEGPALRELFVGLGSALSSLPSGTISRLGIRNLKALTRGIAPVLGNETALAILPGGTVPASAFGSAPSVGLISKGVAAAGALKALRALGKDVSGVVHGNRLVLAGDASALRGLTATGKDLATSSAFRSATAGLASKPALEAYLDLADLVPLFEAAGLAENPAYASFAPEIHRLGGVAATLRPSAHALDAALRLTLSGK